MERDTNQMSQSPSLCRSGCGFYGNPSSDGLCSKCYKDAVKRKQSAPTSSQSLSQSSSSVNHSSAGRNSPISTPLMDSSANLPLLTTTFENTLNTASPTVPSAIIASVQELITKLETSSDSLLLQEMKRNKKNPKQKQNESKKPKASDKQEVPNPVQNNTEAQSETSDQKKLSKVSPQQNSDSKKQNSIDSNTDQLVEQNQTTTSVESESDQKLGDSYESSDEDEINQTDDSLNDGSENQDSSNQSNVVNNTTVETNSNGSSQTTPQSESNPPKTQKKKKNRCTKCKVNVGVIGFPCRCGGTFCSSHRYANEHNCTFDYREHGAEEIRKNNPQVIGEKVTKI